MVEPINDGETYQITTCEDSGFAVLAETIIGGEHDAALFAHARQDLPAALLEIARLREILAYGGLREFMERRDNPKRDEPK